MNFKHARDTFGVEGQLAGVSDLYTILGSRNPALAHTFKIIES
jgi:hypothetical protein